MKHGRAVAIAATCVGVVAILVGVGMIGGYVLEAVIRRVGEPDQSLLFWYLPLLFIGIMCTMAGIGATAWGVSRLRSSNPSTEGVRE
jgi:drug/metabolite transporter (DMT)-like permease